MIGFTLLQGLLLAIYMLLFKGVGVWGINIPVGWGFDIINFVWWIGIGHAGTLISAILLLFRQQWRTSINRAAEAMTLFAVACALLFPIFHTGRPWLAAYWLLPYPNTMGVWPQFRSPLIWDVFAVSTYGTVSALFWFTGLIPDLATMRDRAQVARSAQFIYGVLAMGWRGSARHWQIYETAYLILAGLSTPLVLSVHTVVSFDFAVSLLPGWHATIFPPYFVAGAIYSGFAMVLTLLIPMRSIYGLQDMITMRHLENMAKVMLVTGLIVFYGYMMEAFFAWYSANEFEKYMIYNRTTGPYWYMYWTLILCNGVVPQLLWIKKIRLNVGILFVHLDHREHRDVARALRHHRHQPAPRLPAVVVGHVSGEPLRLVLLHRDDGPVPDAVLPVHPGAADDRHLRDAHAAARSRAHKDVATRDGATRVGLPTVETRTTMADTPLYGLMAEFTTTDALVSAAERVHQRGLHAHRRADAHADHGLAEAMGYDDRRIQKMILAGGLFGCLAGLGLQLHVNLMGTNLNIGGVYLTGYPLNIGGRPLVSLPSFIVPAFETTILFAALTAVIGTLALCGLPQPYHPVFNVKRFRERGSTDGLFLCVEADGSEVRHGAHARAAPGPRGERGV